MNLVKHTLKEITPPEYSKEEREKIIQYFMNLKGDLIRDFLTSYDLPKSGTKPKLIEHIQEYLDDGIFEYKDLVNFLDTIVPWGKQHVFLYYGPESEVEKWRDEEYCYKVIKENKLSQYLNTRIPLILPKSITISSIEYIPSRQLKIYSVESREYWQRKKELDKIIKQKNEEIELRAYLHLVTRGIIIFKWDLISNSATLQISQLPSGSKYEEVEERFGQLIESVLNFKLFQKIDLRPVIKKLHELEDIGNKETRSHGIDYRTLGGRIISARSSTPRDSVLGEQAVDDALSNISKRGVGHIGNFYWLPSSMNKKKGNTLENEVHTIIVGNKGRINFPTHNKKGDIEYVLSRMRSISK